MSRLNIGVSPSRGSLLSEHVYSMRANMRNRVGGPEASQWLNLRSPNDGIMCVFTRSTLPLNTGRTPTLAPVATTLLPRYKRDCSLKAPGQTTICSAPLHGYHGPVAHQATRSPFRSLSWTAPGLPRIACIGFPGRHQLRAGFYTRTASAAFPHSFVCWVTSWAGDPPDPRPDRTR